MTGTAVVTGGNSGIGKETALGLARLGWQVVIAVRNPTKGADAVDHLRRASGNDAVTATALDLASFASVRACATSLLDTHERVDVLVNNAGLVVHRRQVTEDGNELQFQVNHLGPFLLTSLLRDRLVASAPARVVMVASHAHKYAGRGLDFDDLQCEHHAYRPFRVYGRTKLMNILFTRELARLLDGTGVTANALHPGYVASNFARDNDTGVLGNVAMILGRPFAISCEKGALTSIHLASSPDVAGVTGQYFYRCSPAQPTAAARDDEAASRLWDVSARLTGVG